MSDYIKRQDLLDLFATDDLPERDGGYVVSVDVVRLNILDQPAADVVDANTCIECQAGMGQKITNAIANTCFWLSAEQWSELTKVIDEVFKC